MSSSLFLHSVVHMLGSPTRSAAQNVGRYCITRISYCRIEMHEVLKSIWSNEELSEQRKECIIVCIHNNGDKTYCNNYRRSSLLSICNTQKVSNVLLSRLIQYVDEIVGDHQCEFRRIRSFVYQIVCVH